MGKTPSAAEEVGTRGPAFASYPSREALLGQLAISRETILMWWNFVARTPEEITAARG